MWKLAWFSTNLPGKVLGSPRGLQLLASTSAGGWITREGDLLSGQPTDSWGFSVSSGLQFPPMELGLRAAVSIIPWYILLSSSIL